MSYLKDLLLRALDDWLRIRWFWTLYAVAGFAFAVLASDAVLDAVVITVCALGGAFLAVTGPALADSLREDGE